MTKKVIQHRRKREGKTNYHKRLSLLKSRKPRLVVRKTANDITVQIVEYKPAGDKILVHANGSQLKKLGWNFETKNTPSAYLVGYLAGKKASKAKIAEAILDAGDQRTIKKSKIYAAVKGAIEAGLNVPCGEEVLPDESRVSGKHIEDFAKVVSEDNKKFKSQFTKSKDAISISKKFEELKKKIEG